MNTEAPDREAAAAPVPLVPPTATPAPGRAHRPALAASGYLSFRLGQEEYGVDILKVQEIRGYEVPTRLAGAPDFIKGVINLRGVIVPVVDLRLKFGLVDVSYGGLTVVIVLNVAQRVIGVVVDSVSDVLEFAADRVCAPPDFNDRIDASYITALGTVRQADAERMLILTDIEHLMSSPEMGLVDLSTAPH